MAKDVKIGSVISLSKRFMQYGQTGGEIRREHVIYEPTLVLRVHAIEHATVDTISGQKKRSAILRTRVIGSDEPVTVVRATDEYTVLGY